MIIFIEVFRKTKKTVATAKFLELLSSYLWRDDYMHPTRRKCSSKIFILILKSQVGLVLFRKCGGTKWRKQKTRLESASLKCMRATWWRGSSGDGSRKFYLVAVDDGSIIFFVPSPASSATDKSYQKSFHHRELKYALICGELEIDLAVSD